MLDQVFEKIPYDTMEDINPLHILLGAAGVGLVLFVVAYFTILGATQDQFEVLHNKKIETERTLKRYQGLAKQKESIFRDLVRTVGQLGAVRKQMPNKEDISNLLKQLTLVGKQVDVDVTLFELNEGEVLDYYMRIPLTIQLRGGFLGTMDVLQHLETMLRLVDFSNLSLTVAKVEVFQIGGADRALGEKHLLFTTLTVNTFVYVPGAEDRVAGKKEDK